MIPAKSAHNIGYPPAGTTAREMISLYLKKATLAQMPLTNPAGFIFRSLWRRKAGSLGRYRTFTKFQLSSQILNLQSRSKQTWKEQSKFI